MACFIVPATEAIVTSIIEKKTKDKSDNIFIQKLGILNNMLWGGCALLAFEHIWHGEVTPWFPFLTNAANAADRAEMIMEMMTSGVGMAVLVTVVWAIIVSVMNNIAKVPVAEVRKIKEKH